MRIAINAHTNPEELKIFDAVLEACNFATRTDYITAVLKTTVYGTSDTSPSLPPHLRSWIDGIRTATQNHDTLLQTAIAVFDELAFPIIAMRGCDIAARQISPELEEAIFTRCGMIPGPGDLRNYLSTYSLLRRPDLLQYRTRELSRTYRAEHPLGAQP